jgi:hypothetical protein
MISRKHHKETGKIDILQNFLNTLTKKTRCINCLTEKYIQIMMKEKWISNQLVIKAISKASGNPSDKVIQEWKKIGDLGKVLKS